MSTIFTFATSNDAVATYPSGLSVADRDLAPWFQTYGDALGYLSDVVDRDDLGPLGFTTRPPSNRWFTLAARALIQLFRENVSLARQPEARQRRATARASGDQLRADERAVRNPRIADAGRLHYNHTLDQLQGA